MTPEARRLPWPLLLLVPAAIAAAVFAWSRKPETTARPESPAPPGPMRAESTDEPKARATEVWAIVIGVDQYRDEAIPPCRGAVRDAGAVAHWLEESAGWGGDHVLLIVDEGGNPAAQPGSDLSARPVPTRDGLDRAFREWLPARVKPGDPVVVYFAGQAVATPGDAVARRQLGPPAERRAIGRPGRERLAARRGDRRPRREGDEPGRPLARHLARRPGSTRAGGHRRRGVGHVDAPPARPLAGRDGLARRRRAPRARGAEGRRHRPVRLGPDRGTRDEGSARGTSTPASASWAATRPWRPRDSGRSAASIPTSTSGRGRSSGRAGRAGRCSSSADTPRGSRRSPSRPTARPDGHGVAGLDDQGLGPVRPPAPPLVELPSRGRDLPGAQPRRPAPGERRWRRPAPRLGLRSGPAPPRVAAPRARRRLRRLPPRRPAPRQPRHGREGLALGPRRADRPGAPPIGRGDRDRLRLGARAGRAGRRPPRRQAPNLRPGGGRARDGGRAGRARRRPGADDGRACRRRRGRRRGSHPMGRRDEGQARPFEVRGGDRGGRTLIGWRPRRRQRHGPGLDAIGDRARREAIAEAG